MTILSEEHLNEYLNKGEWYGTRLVGVMDVRSMAQELLLARRVVEAARIFAGDHSYCSGHCGACETVSTLKAYDALSNGTGGKQ